MKIQKDMIPKYNNKSGTNLMKVTVPTLDIFCRYVLADPKLVKISHIASLNMFIQTLDPSTYSTDPDKVNRIMFIKRGLEARIKYNLTDRSLILTHIISGLKFDPDFIDNNELSAKEIEWCNNFIEESIKFSFIYRYADQFIELCTQVKTSDFEHRGGVIHDFSGLIDSFKNEFRKATINDNIIDMEFGLEDGEFEKDVAEIYNIVTSPSRRLLSGMQGLNAMIGGGFESGRVYMLLGITGVGKSVTLLNLAYQIKKYNVNYKTKDPSKIPCVVYLTQENTVVETVTRLFDMITDSQYGMSSYSLPEVIKKLREEGGLSLSDNSPINLKIKYRPNRAISTSYLYDLYDDLDDQGFEPICLIQDHLLRIRSIESTNEPRFELGNIVNEFKTFAAEKDIPVISNFHLNREAMKSIETYGKRSTHIDVTQKLGKSNVSESVMILNNSDCSIIINKDQDQDGQVYMGFNLIKMRDKTNVFYFAQPFAYGGEIKLVEDVNGPAMYKTTIHGGDNAMRIANVKTSSSNALNSINVITQNNGPMDASFNESSHYENLIHEEDDIVIEPEPEKKVIKPAVIDPFIYNLPKEDPFKAVKEKKESLKAFKEQLLARQSQ